MKASRRVYFKKNDVLESLPKPRKISEEFEGRKLFILHFQKNEGISRMGM